jgi:putative peptidoglycan lipid II flippase
MPDTESPKSFLHHARLIGGLTLLSRVLGLAREAAAGHYLGTGLVASAFTLAFTVPNLFRKLLGEGALAQAFIPLYAQAVRRGRTEGDADPADFAAGSVKLLVMVLLAITVLGEVVLIGAMLLLGDAYRPDRLLMLQFTAVMLPYVLLVCGGAFLSAILQVHKRFGVPAAAPLVLNLIHIGVVVGGAWFLGLSGRAAGSPGVEALQTKLAFALAVGVLVAGVMQVGILIPALKAIGFRLRLRGPAWTPDTRKMIRLSLPVALGAAVLQISVLLDKSISYTLMQGVDHAGRLLTHFDFFGHSVRYPMELGVTRRLDLAQLMYQFPLGVFAIALATAIFPSLSAGGADTDKTEFKRVCRQGVTATLWEGVPATVGLILVAGPAVRLLFQHGQTTAGDATLIAHSTMWYAGGVWAYSLLQVVNRAFYALHDTTTPLVASAANICLNLAVELPLVWRMGEAGMAVGTMVSFSLQAIVMLWLLDRRVGGIGLREIGGQTLRILTGTGVMLCVCLLVRYSPLYPAGDTRGAWAGQLTLVTATGAVTYLLMSHLLGLHVPLRKKR